MAASVRRRRSQSCEVRRRDVLLAVLFASRKKHGGGGGGVLLKNMCAEVVPRGAAAADARTAHRAVKQYLQEAVDFGVLTKDSRRRYSFAGDVRRYAETQGLTVTQNKKKKRSKGTQADVDTDNGSSTSRSTASETDANAATSTADVSQVTDEITTGMLRVNIGVRRGGERRAKNRKAPVVAGNADQRDHDVIFKDESKNVLFLSKQENSSPTPTVIDLESTQNHDSTTALKEEDFKIFK